MLVRTLEENTQDGRTRLEVKSTMGTLTNGTMVWTGLT